MRKLFANSRACSLQCAAQNGLVVTAENRYTAGFSHLSRWQKTAVPSSIFTATFDEFITSSDLSIQPEQISVYGGPDAPDASVAWFRVVPFGAAPGVPLGPRSSARGCGEGVNVGHPVQ
jgi:hypothetical protein